MVAQTSSSNSVVIAKKPRYRFRGPYKKHPKPLSPYKLLAQIHEKLASFYPIWIKKDKDCVVEFWGLRLWQRVYPHERIKDKLRVVPEAEIIGSENLYIEDRLKLHSLLLSLLESGYGLYEAMLQIRVEFKKIQKPKIGDFAQWLKQLRG